MLTKHSRAATKYQVLGIVAISTTQWFNFNDADMPLEDRRMMLDRIGLYGGLWRACIVVEDMGESIKSCANIGSGSAKLNAVRSMTILCIMFSFMIMFTSIAIALASKKLALPSFLGSFLAMGTGISAVAVYASYIDDINVTNLGRNDVLNWSYWLMVTAAALTGIPLIMNTMNAIKKWDVAQPAVVDPEQPVTPTEAPVQEPPKAETVD